MSLSTVSQFVMIFGINLMLWLFVECWATLVEFPNLGHTLELCQLIMPWMMYFVQGQKQVFWTVLTQPLTIVRPMKELGLFVLQVSCAIIVIVFLQNVPDEEITTGLDEVNITSNQRFQWIFNNWENKDKPVKDPLD